MEVYESHLGGIYFSDKIVDYEYLYCDQCGDSDWHLGHADTWEEVLEMITDEDDWCPYSEEMVAEWKAEFEARLTERGESDERGLFSYRQILDNDILVQCENCKYNPDKPHKYYNDDFIYSYSWCPKFIEELNGKGFCPYGKEIENA